VTQRRKTGRRVYISGESPATACAEQKEGVDNGQDVNWRDTVITRGNEGATRRTSDERGMVGRQNGEVEGMGGTEEGIWPEQG
jgi:hypothetical protein